MSDSVRPHRRQLTRLPRPWDSPGKNTGVGCHFLLQCMKVKSESEVAQSCLTLSNPNGLQPTRLLHPWDFPGKSTGVGCHCLLRRPPYPSSTPRVYTNSCLLSWCCNPTILFSVIPFSSHLQTFPTSGSFQLSQIFNQVAKTLEFQLQH